MDELNLRDLLKYYLKKLPAITLTIILFILLGYTYTKYYQIPMYHASATIILVQKNEGSTNETITQNELSVNEKLVKTYSEIIKSRRVLEQVIEELHLKTTTKELSKTIEVTSVSDTAILEIVVTDDNSTNAALIANKIAEVFKKEITNIYNLENVSIIDNAIIEKKPYNINLVKQLIICAIAGLLLSCILIFIVYYFDTTIKSKKTIESKLNLPVLAEIPVSTKLIKEKKKAKTQQKLESHFSKNSPNTNSHHSTIPTKKQNSNSKPKTTSKPTSKSSKSKSTTQKTKTPSKKVKAGDK